MYMAEKKREEMISREVVIEGYEIRTSLSKSELPHFEASVEKLSKKIEYYKERTQALHPSKIILLASLSILMEHNKEVEEVSEKLALIKKKLNVK